MAAFKYSAVFALVFALSLVAATFAEETDGKVAEESKVEQSDDKVPKPCSSNKPDECPYNLDRKGVFDWVKDSTQYEWIFVAFCIVLGCCIFIFVISAAIYNARTYKKKAAEEARHIREEDERARALLRSERVGSHSAHPRRESFSVSIEDPASKRKQ